MLVQDYNPHVDPLFLKKHFKPYLKVLFADLSIQSEKGGREKSIDRVTFTEYINLPGILRERCYKLVCSSDHRIYIEKFCLIFELVFASQLYDKMALAFKL